MGGFTILNTTESKYNFAFLNSPVSNESNEVFLLLSLEETTCKMMINCKFINKYDPNYLFEILKINEDLPTFIKGDIINEIYLKSCFQQKDRVLSKALTDYLNEEGV